MENNILHETSTGFLIQMADLQLDHGRFLFEAPPFEEDFGYTIEAIPGDIIKTCWGLCRNVEGIDDYFGIAIVDKDDMTLIQGYYTDIKIPLYEFASWYTIQDQIMPNHDWNLICYVGYYRIEENILHATDWREFTIKSFTEKKFPFWVLLLTPLLLIPMIKKKNFK